MRTTACLAPAAACENLLAPPGRLPPPNFAYDAPHRHPVVRNATVWTATSACDAPRQLVLTTGAGATTDYHFAPRGHTFGESLAENDFQIAANPINHRDPSGLVDISDILVKAGRQYLKRVFDMYSATNPSHSKTNGPVPFILGGLWGITQGYLDSDLPLTADLALKRTAEFGAMPVFTYILYNVALYSRSPTLFGVSRWSAIGARISLYAAAAYIGYSIGNRISCEQLMLEAEWYKLDKLVVEGGKLNGELIAARILQNMQPVNGVTIGPSEPQAAAAQLRRAYGAAGGTFAYWAWHDMFGDSYEKYKAKNGHYGEIDPSRFEDLMKRQETALTKFAQAVVQQGNGGGQ